MASEFPDDWVSEEDIKSLGLEKDYNPATSHVAFAERLIVETAPRAAMTIARLATDSTVNDRVRLTAATYIMDRACGKIGEGAKSDDGKDPWANVFDAVTRDAENYANGG